MKILKYTLSFVVFFFIVSCSLNDSDSNTQEEEFAYLIKQKEIIEQMAVSVPCTENTSCDYVAFGSKPCGGSWTYLAYNTGINVDLFLQRVADYNSKENEYNIKWGIISDCAVPAPPISVDCIDGVCTAIYN
jgi:hypothetical protein